MIQALNEAAFSPGLAPESLWRASCPWKSQGYDEHAEWLHEMAVTLLDIQELPTCEEPVEVSVDPRYAHIRHITGPFGSTRALDAREAQSLLRPDDDIPY